MRHGSVQPFSVTTGWYSCPFAGANGGCMSGDEFVGASGIAASFARPLTVATLASATAEP